MAIVTMKKKYIVINGVEFYKQIGRNNCGNVVRQQNQSKSVYLGQLINPNNAIVTFLYLFY